MIMSRKHHNYAKVISAKMWSTMAIFENYIWNGDVFLKNDICGVTILG